VLDEKSANPTLQLRRANPLLSQGFTKFYTVCAQSPVIAAHFVCFEERFMKIG